MTTIDLGPKVPLKVAPWIDLPISFFVRSDLLGYIPDLQPIDIEDELRETAALRLGSREYSTLQPYRTGTGEPHADHHSGRR